jgi:cytochrome P450
MLKLHHDSQKGASYRGFAPIQWSESLQSWCVFDADFMIAIMKSQDFVVVDYAAEYGRLAQRTRIDWQCLVDVLHSIPLTSEGTHHTQLRRDFAQLISARSAAAKAAVAEFADKSIPLLFRNRQRSELVDDLIEPVTDLLFGILLGVPVPEVSLKGPSVSQIFDRSLSLNRRIQLQDALRHLSKSLADKTNDLTTSIEYATALLVVGHDSLLGSLGASLVALLEEQAEGARLCDISYPATLPRTGVPYVERVAKRDCTARGTEFRAGDRIRLFLDACPARGTSSNEAPYFGKGRHLCLGMDLTQWVWRTLTHSLAPLPFRLRIIETRLRENDYVFNVYDRIEVSVHE